MKNKITIGYVIQVFDTNTKTCIKQEFIAGDQVEWETVTGQPYDCDEEEHSFVFEMYQPYEMVQPS